MIWVNDGAVKTNRTLNNTKFVVDLGNTLYYGQVYAGAEIMTDTPSWLISYTVSSVDGSVSVTPWLDVSSSVDTASEWQKIMWEQNGYSAPAATISRTITFSLPTSDIAPSTVNPADPLNGATKISQIFASMSVGTSAGDLKAMALSADGTEYSYTFTFDPNKGESVPTMYYYDFTFVPGYEANGTVTFESANATVVNANKLFSVATDVEKVVLDLDTDTVQYDAANVTDAELAAAKTAAKKLVDEYVAAEIAKKTTADQAILNANLTPNTTALGGAINTVKTDIDKAGTVSGVNAIIAKSAAGNFTGTGLSGLNTALGAVSVSGSQLKEIDDARKAAVAALQAKLAAVNNNAAALEIYNTAVEKINNTDLTTAAITATETKAVADMQAVYDEAITPAPSVPSKEELAAEEDFQDGGKFAGMQQYITPDVTVVKDEDAANAYDITVSFPVGTIFDATSAGPFAGFGNSNGAAVLTSLGLNGISGAKFGFAAFNIGENTALIVVSNVSNGSVVTAGTEKANTTTITFPGDPTTYTLNWKITFAA